MKLRRHVIIRAVGASGEHRFSALLEVFDALGHEVRVQLVDTPTETAELRNVVHADAERLRIDRQQLASLHPEASAPLGEWKDLPATFRAGRHRAAALTRVASNDRL